MVHKGEKGNEKKRKIKTSIIRDKNNRWNALIGPHAISHSCEFSSIINI